MIEYDPFAGKLADVGIDPGGELVAGKLTRATCSCKPAKKGRDGNGWYLYHADDPATLTWGCWNSDCPNAAGGKLTAKNETALTTAERETIKARIEADRKAREMERQQVEKTVRDKAARLWSSGHDVSADHDYIVNGGNFRPVGARQVKDMLLIPMSATGTGDPESLQLIFPDSSKKYLTGTGAIPGPLYHVIRGTNTGPLYEVEGWKTGCSVHAATGASVVVAFSSGKLPAVAAALRERFPDREIIIAGDTGNGSSKATEAALKIGGKVVFPVMPEGATGTDFNDLHQTAGLGEVARQLAAAALPVPAEAVSIVEPIQGQGPNAETQTQATAESPLNPMRVAVERLARLSPLEYDLIRKNEATALGVRPGTLDIEVKAMRKQAAADDTPFEEVEPWPVPVDGAALLDQITATVQRFIVCSQETAQAVSLWVALTWFVDVVQVAPLAVITAPEKRCGKSMLLFLMGRMVPRPIMASSITPSALFRSIDAWKPTLLIDEVDACLKDNEELRGVLNAGHTRDSAFVIRCVGDDHVPTKFNVWGCKVLSGIGHVADTLMDRAIILELRRKLPHESIERIRHAEPGLFAELSSRLARFSDDNSEQVRLARPDLPHALNDRAQDNWEPLLAIASAAGGNWLATATAAAMKLSGRDSAAQSIGVELLADIRDVFEEKHVDRISSADLIKELCSDDEKPWATYNRGFQIKPRQIASKLKGYGIHSKTIRIGSGETPKGYELIQFKEAFSRYIPSTPLLSATTPQRPEIAGLRGLSISNVPATATTHPPHATSLVADNPQRGGSVADRERLNMLESQACCVVADREPFSALEVIDLPDFSLDGDGIPDFDIDLDEGVQS
jgi:putative DNA primase/helicase